jgi:DNA-binding NarL/FixJ family response regulator
MPAIVGHVRRGAKGPSTEESQSTDEWEAMAEGEIPLTPREREVATLIGNGYSNEQIARALAISRNTVRQHVANISRKLGLRSRPQIAVWAFQQMLS